jgi:hypothetical protein
MVGALPPLPIAVVVTLLMPRDGVSRALANAPDPDAPPPKFMTAQETMSAGRAVVFGGSWP